MEILIRQHIERHKKLFPVWLGVSKAEVEERHIGLGGIVAITGNLPTHQVISKLVEAMSDFASFRGVIPSWENPAHRFLNGLGEVRLQTSDGAATSIFELLINRKDSEFPFWLAGKTYSKDELLSHVAQLLGPVPDRVRSWVSEDGYQKLWNMCIEHNLHPNNFH